MIWGACLAFTFVFSFVTVNVDRALGASVNLTLGHTSAEDEVSVLLANESAEEVRLKGVSVELNSRRYQRPLDELIAAQGQRVFRFKVDFPSAPGSYVLTATVQYLNAGQLLSLKHPGLFHFQGPSTSDVTCRISDTSINREGTVTVSSQQPAPWHLILPDEVEVYASEDQPTGRKFYIRSRVTGVSNKYPYFAATEVMRDGRHQATLCAASLWVGGDTSAVWAQSSAGRLPPSVLLGVALVSLGAFAVLLFRRPERGLAGVALAKYCARMFFLFAAYLLLKSLPAMIEVSSTWVTSQLYRDAAAIAAAHFSGPNYLSFYRYFVDPYCLVYGISGYPLLYYRDRDRTWESDKYIAAVGWLLDVAAWPWCRRLRWGPLARLGMLSVAVKVFYIPLLTSWCINNTFHQFNLTSTFSWTLASVTAYLQALFIYFDTTVYAFGYSVESKALNSEIKSVEHTLLGWLVTLWCYPPFNLFSFRVFDYAVVDVRSSYPVWILTAASCCVMVLWGVFAWASVSLGFKASNLTNRGIVSSGPYRYCRHPAYAAKLGIWVIETLFFGTYGVGLFLGFALIYVMRAVTEERHLAEDHAYVDYRRGVRWFLIPGVL